MADKAIALELLDRAVIQFRRGQNAAANLSYMAYAHVTGGPVAVVAARIQAGDFLGAADVLEAMKEKHR